MTPQALAHLRPAPLALALMRGLGEFAALQRCRLAEWLAR